MGAIQPGMINKDHFQIFITHMPTQETVNFDGWVTQFTDNFASTWTGTPVYGRMDDLYTFQKTSRTISLAFDVVAANQFEAAKNVRKLNKLAQFLYPAYSQPGSGTGARGAQALQGAPLLKMKWNGLISDAAEGTSLVGYLRGFNYDPDIDQGQFFIPGRNTKKPFIAYQTHRVRLQYIVIHSHLTGWVQQTVQDAGGRTKYVFGADPQKPLGATFPHAVSAPTRLPRPPADEKATGKVTPPEPSVQNSDPSIDSLPYDHLDDDYLAARLDSCSTLDDSDGELSIEQCRSMAFQSRHRARIFAAQRAEILEGRDSLRVRASAEALERIGNFEDTEGTGWWRNWRQGIDHEWDSFRPPEHVESEFDHLLPWQGLDVI